MTDLTEQFTGIARRSFEATSTAARTWTETLQKYTGGAAADHRTDRTDRTADLRTIVAAGFDLATTLLGEQRTLACGMIDAGAEATGAWTEQARTAAAAMPFRLVDVTAHGAAA